MFWYLETKIYLLKFASPRYESETNEIIKYVK